MLVVSQLSGRHPALFVVHYYWLVEHRISLPSGLSAIKAFLPEIINLSVRLGFPPKLNQVVVLPKPNQVGMWTEPNQADVLHKPNQVVVLPN